MPFVFFPLPQSRTQILEAIRSFNGSMPAALQNAALGYVMFEKA